MCDRRHSSTKSERLLAVSSGLSEQQHRNRRVIRLIRSLLCRSGDWNRMHYKGSAAPDLSRDIVASPQDSRAIESRFMLPTSWR